jgi:transporter family protein
LAPWVLPTAGFVVLLGLLGVTTKLALRSLEWPDLVLWTALAYGGTALVLIAVGRGSLRWVSDTPWAAATGVIPAIALVLFFVAVNSGEVSRIVAIGAAYPLITALLAVLLLDETVTPPRLAGMLLVVVGVVLLSV